MRRSDLGKDFTLIFHSGQAIDSLWLPNLTRDLQKKTKKGALRWHGWTDAECLVQANERTIIIGTSLMSLIIIWLV